MGRNLTMLFIRGQVQVATTALRLCAGASPGLLVIASHRSNAIYDTRVLPADAPLLHGGVVLYVLLQGQLEWHATGETLCGPLWFVVRDEVFEGAGGPDAPTFRTQGNDLHAIEVRLSSASLAETAPQKLEPGPLLVAAEAFQAACFREPHDAPHARRQALVLLGALRDRGLVTAALVRHVETAPPFVERLWSAGSALLAGLDTSATLSLLALASAQSERQARRDVDSGFRALRLPYQGWRDAAQRWRLRMAIVLLSAPEATIQDVARTVGYRHAEALANSFQRAGLPSPRELRVRLG